MGLSNVLFRHRILNDPLSKPHRRQQSTQSEPTESFPDVASELKSRIQSLYTTHLAPDGSSVDYTSLRTSPEFSQYLLSTEKLLHVPQSSLISMKDEEKISFFINLYNALTIHASVVCGHPETSIGRLKLNAEASYNVGGLRFSLSEIENGVLRGNSAFMMFGPPFRKGDIRNQVALNKACERIHFALNCGATSCPPIRYFTKDNLEFGLSAATESFLEADDNLMVMPKERMVRASMIFKWYMKDFSKNLQPLEVLKWIATNMDQESEKCIMLKRMLEQDEGKGEIKLKYLPYNWDLNDAAGLVT